MNRDEYGRFKKGLDDEEEESHVGKTLAEIGIGGGAGAGAAYGAKKAAGHAARAAEKGANSLAKKGKDTLLKGMNTISMSERAKKAAPFFKAGEAAEKGSSALRRLMKMHGGKVAGIGGAAGAALGGIAALLGDDDDED